MFRRRVKSKKQMAEELINRLKKMDQVDIKLLVDKTIGNELEAYLREYATDKMSTKMKVGTGVILMLIGYLARANEEREDAKEYSYTPTTSVPGVSA